MAEQAVPGPGHRVVVMLSDGSQIVYFAPGSDVFADLDRVRAMVSLSKADAVRVTMDTMD